MKEFKDLEFNVRFGAESTEHWFGHLGRRAYVQFENGLGISVGYGKGIPDDGKGIMYAITVMCGGWQVPADMHKVWELDTILKNITEEQVSEYMKKIAEIERTQ